MNLRWNERYDSAKPTLVRQLQALMQISDKGQLVQAEQVVVAVRSLPTVGEHRGGLRIVDRVARRLGDSDFFYSLSISDEGFELSYHEEMKIGEELREYAYPDTLVQCRPIDCKADDESSDEEALANMRHQIELMIGERLDDEDWLMQVEDASAHDDLVPNGILRWLEMLPVDDDGTCSDSVSLEWR